LVNGICSGGNRKKISCAADESAAAVGTDNKWRQKDAGTDNAINDAIIKANFGDELLFACYAFYDKFKNKPKDWLELFEYVKYLNVQNIYKEMAMRNASTEGEK